MTASVRVYSYGADRPTEGGEIVAQQISAAHRYRNRLVEIERARRAKIVEAKKELPDLAPIEAELAAVSADLEAERAAIKGARSRSRGKADLTAQKARVAELRGKADEVRGRLRQARAAIKGDPRLQAIYDAADAEASTAIKAARAACECYWGTYLLIEEAANRARMQAASPGRPWHEQPAFARWDGHGRVGVQIQGGLTVADLHACEDSRLRLSAPPEGVYQLPRGERKRATRKMAVRIRVGSQGRDPIWAEFPVTLHRPLPPDGVIKWAWVQRRRVGVRYKYDLQIVVESETHDGTPQTESGHAVAINLGWRRMRDGSLRAGYWRGSDGRGGPICVPPEVARGLTTVSQVAATRDEHLNQVRAVLGAWLAARGEVPAWLSAAVLHMDQWRSAGRMQGLLRRWQENRFPGDDIIVAALEEWTRRDHHLLAWEANQRDRRLGLRDAEYQKLAVHLSREYGTILVDSVDLRDLTSAPEAEEGAQDEGREQRAAARVASPGLLRQRIEEAAKKRGCALEKVNTAWMTRTCHACGDVDETWDRRVEVEHTCRACGVAWDQDDNWCRNALARERGGDAQARGGARSVDSTVAEGEEAAQSAPAG